MFDDALFVREYLEALIHIFLNAYATFAHPFTTKLYLPLYGGRPFSI
jgi:hypothetical protein